jgi:hypothetical protein
MPPLPTAYGLPTKCSVEEEDEEIISADLITTHVRDACFWTICHRQGAAGMEKFLQRDKPGRATVRDDRSVANG